MLVSQTVPKKNEKWKLILLILGKELHTLGKKTFSRLESTQEPKGTLYYLSLYKSLL